MASTVYDEVEAALLNSEGNPIREVEAAFEAVAAFTYSELQVSEDQFVEMAKAAWKAGIRRALD